MARIVVIEEDALIRGLLEEWLGSEGHDVLPRRSVDALGDDIGDLVVVDVHTPRHGGCTALHRLQAAHPELPVIAISAHFVHGRSSVAAAQALGVQRIVGKPFSRADLVGAVRDVLGVPH